MLQPTTTGADPMKWNRAVLKKVFTKGFVEIRPPDPAGHAACGDTSQYSVEEDSMVTVYGLPCGLNFRYAAVVAGNDGLDFPACAFDSQEAELDAVAGLTEDGAGVCPDQDHDGYVACNCAGAPAVCDCNDADPNRCTAARASAATPGRASATSFPSMPGWTRASPTRARAVTMAARAPTEAPRRVTAAGPAPSARARAATAARWTACWPSSRWPCCAAARAE